METKCMELIEKELLLLEEKLLTPEVRTSVKELSNLLAEDFFEIGSSGQIWRVKDRMDVNGIDVVRMQLSDFEIHPLSENIVLTTYKIFNEDKQQHSLRSSIWKYEHSKWQMVFHQGTPTS
ncbi:nuclear transport factor 2 family protein [Paenibacillus sp. FSL R7-0333]|uniref:nuclear transport factor 2 family protein n=1 Tax=Paenibacillus sp. FSL R7-0333 TaxID=1926587 RepID=UPI002688AE24